MGLRDTAQADMTKFLGDTVTGFGWPIVVTDPAGVSGELSGLSPDISQVIDPDTGEAVSGRLASVALSIAALAAVGLVLPQGISDSASKPWVIEFQDISLNDFKFKVQKSNPDRMLGMVTCILELYE